MQKFIFLILTLFAFNPSSSHAQLIANFGFKSGLVIANQNFSGILVRSFQNRVGIDSGLFFEWIKLPYFSLLTEVHYTQKGMIDDTPFLSVSESNISTYNNRIDYLSFPLLAKFPFKDGKVFPYFIVGPRLDLLLGRTPDNFQLIYNNLNKAILGTDVGIGIEINISPLLTTLYEFRYNHDFTKAFNNSSLQVKNRSFQFLVGFQL